MGNSGILRGALEDLARDSRGEFKILNRCNVSYVNSVDHDGEYWSSTSSGEFDAYLLDFYSENVGTNYESIRFFGYSVRLVIDCYEI